ncbi:MAG: DUF1232 domain-containing protein [Armatimonadota bacterium]
MNRGVRLAEAARNPKNPKGVRIAAALGVLYILFPFDFLPDLMPVVGWIDDLLVIVGVVAYILGQRKKSLETR